jgi:two-component system, chemotaxis family, protein-glutamate methylesterase/glutaminase
MCETVFNIVVIGTSMGGMQALHVLLDGLPEDYPLPVAIVQHRSAESGDGLRMTLQRFSHLRVREPQDKEPIVGGKVYVAPADYHLLVDDGAFALSTDSPVFFARPSVDVLFESAADAFGAGVIGVILTGANSDGARGVQRIKRAGGYVIVQDPDEADRPEMPRAALKSSAVDRILPLGEIASTLVTLVRDGRG